MPDPAPLPASDLLVDWLLSRPLPQLFVADLLRPSDVKDASKTHVDEGLDLLHGGFCHSPCLRAIQQHGLDVGVEEAKLGGRFLIM